MSQPLHVLVVDDDPHMARHVGLLARLSIKPTRLHLASSGDEALAQLEHAAQPDARLVVVSDYDLGGGPDGLAVLRAARERSPDARLILMSGKDASTFGAALASADVHAFVEKPFSVDAMQATLAAAAGAP